jgi:hypothetical protein
MLTATEAEGGARFVDKPAMTGMQRTHGGHQAEGTPRLPPPDTQLRDRVDCPQPYFASTSRFVSTRWLTTGNRPICTSSAYALAAATVCSPKSA